MIRATRFTILDASLLLRFSKGKHESSHTASESQVSTHTNAPAANDISPVGFFLNDSGLYAIISPGRTLEPNLNLSFITKSFFR